jgi:hypothetical protein
MGRKKSSFPADSKGNYRRGQSAVHTHVSIDQFRLRQSGCLPPDWRALIERLLQFRHHRGIPIRLLQLRNLLHAIIRSERALEHDCGGCIDVAGSSRDGGGF